MSSLLAIQTKDDIFFASDTASSVTIDNKAYRVSDKETKLFLIDNYIVFASGNLAAQQLLIGYIKNGFEVDELESVLKRNFICLGEYSLEVLIGEKRENKTILHTFSSYNNFNHVKSINNSRETFLFTAGLKTVEISNSFENNISKGMDVSHAIREAYQKNYCERIGGSIETISLSSRKKTSFQLSEKILNRKTLKHDIHLIVGERIYGKIIMGVNLAIEDESGILKFRGSRGQIFDRNGDEQMRLGLVTDPPDEECFGILLDNRKHRVHMTSCDGFMIEKWESSSWKKKMYADLDGNFWVENFTAKEITIIDNDGYFNFEGNKGKISDGNSPVMWLGYIPAGSVTICSPPSDFGTILKGTNNSLIYMTKNRGFAIDVNCENKFRVDTDGNLYAQDMVAHNLKIVDGELGEKIILDHEDGITINGNDGEQIRLNANEGIAVDVQGDKRIWIGKDGLIYAKKLYIMGDEDDEIIEDVDGSYVSDLTVNKLKTLNSNQPQDYIHIEDNYIKMQTRLPSNNESVTQMSISISPPDENSSFAYPSSKWGIGNTNGLNVGHLYKNENGFHWNLHAKDSQFRKISLNDTIEDSILLETPHNIRLKGEKKIRLEVNANNYIELTPQGLKLVGVKIDLN